jgi:hypothetical protein
VPISSSRANAQRDGNTRGVDEVTLKTAPVGATAGAGEERHALEPKLRGEEPSGVLP